MNGRKRHIAVDTLGMVLAVCTHSAALQDRDGALVVLDRVKSKGLERLEFIYADQGYTGELATKAFWLFDYVLRVVKRREGAVGFEVLPKRWIVERTFAWLGRHRLLSKDYEVRPDTSDADVHVAMTALMLNRLKPRNGPRQKWKRAAT